MIDLDVGEPGAGDVVVDTAFSGISSGTETLAFKGLIDPDTVLDESIPSLRGTFAFPFRYGYSCVGTVRSGALEEGRQVFCLHPHQSVLVRPADELIPVDDVDARIATLLPVVETGLQIALDVGSVEGPVVVFGLGAVGITAAAILAQSGVEVIGAEPLRSRRDAAGEFGLQAVAPEEVPTDVPVIIECSGNADALTQGLDHLAHEGTAFVASWYGEKPVSLPLGGPFHRRRLTIRSTQVSSIPRHLQDEWTFEKRTARAVELLSELPLHVVATHTFPLDRVQDAFEAADSGANGLIHAALSYD